MGAVGGGPAIHHLTKKQANVRIFMQFLFLCDPTVPKTSTGIPGAKAYFLGSPTPYGLRPTTKYDSDTT
jgi:hypothetical protein